MGIKFIIRCDVCNRSEEKEVSNFGFIGVGENGFLVRSTETYSVGWRGENGKIFCPFCFLWEENMQEEIICQKCKKVKVFVTREYDSIDGIRKLASKYDFEEISGSFYCVDCKKEVKSEKTKNDSGSTPR